MLAVPQTTLKKKNQEEAQLPRDEPSFCKDTLNNKEGWQEPGIISRKIS
jgi:hypothetical protein